MDTIFFIKSRSILVYNKPTRCNSGSIVFINNYKYALRVSGGFGGLGVACWPLVPKFADSNPAETVAFLMAKKSSARLPSEGK